MLAGERAALPAPFAIAGLFAQRRNKPYQQNIDQLRNF